MHHCSADTPTRNFWYLRFFGKLFQIVFFIKVYLREILIPLILGTWNNSHAKFFLETSNFLYLKIGIFHYVLVHSDILIHLFSISLLGKNLVGQDAVVSSAKFSYQAPGRSQCIISYTHINLSSIINTNITINLSINLVNINTNISVSIDTLHAKRKTLHSGTFQPGHFFKTIQKLWQSRKFADYSERFSFYPMASQVVAQLQNFQTSQKILISDTNCSICPETKTVP